MPKNLRSGCAQCWISTISLLIWGDEMRRKTGQLLGIVANVLSCALVFCLGSWLASPKPLVFVGAVALVLVIDLLIGWLLRRMD